LAIEKYITFGVLGFILLLIAGLLAIFRKYISSYGEENKEVKI
jgi:hypothetical protein